MYKWLSKIAEEEYSWNHYGKTGYTQPEKFKLTEILWLCVFAFLNGIYKRTKKLYNFLSKINEKISVKKHDSS
jgi:hypothetical protein